jgi:protein arginine kinase
MNTASRASPDAWYTEDGPDSDVVLSSRVRVARNLSGYNFPIAIKSDDAEHVLSLVFDAFNQLEHPDHYQMVRLSGIDGTGKRILAERGVIEPGTGSEPWRGVIIRNDGVISASINIEDHLRIAAFAPGFALRPLGTLVSGIETEMQKRLRFSATHDFGYLTSNIMNVGTGIKASTLVCLPGLCLNGLMDRVMREYLAQGFVIRGYYGGEEGTSLGCLYQLSNASSASGNAESQIVGIEHAVRKLVEIERKSRLEALSSSPTTVEDSVFRAIVILKYARFIALNEAMDLLQRVRLGVNLGLITGVANKELTALMYRVQSAHIGFVISDGSIIIEGDVRTDEMRMNRIRAMVIQEILKNADIHERR